MLRGAGPRSKPQHGGNFQLSTGAQPADNPRVFAKILQRWEVSSSTGTHFEMLDGLRGVAILLVVAYHSLYTNPGHGAVFKLINWGVLQAGWMGVPIFFVLSGFLISYPFFQKRGENPQFWYQRGYVLRRVAKIIPPFYLSIVFFLVYYRLFAWSPEWSSAYLDSAWKWATGLGNFIPPDPVFNGSYWSLIIEAHFYILLPLLFWLTRGLSAQKTGGILFALFVLGPLLARHAVWPDNLFVLPDWTTEICKQTTFKLGRFPGQMDYFGWGIIFSAMFVALRKNATLEQLRPLAVLGYAGVILMGITLVYWGMWEDQFDTRVHIPQWNIEISHLLPAAAAMLMLFFLFDAQSWGARFFRMGWLRFVGVVSFEWFLFHGPLVRWFLDHQKVHAGGNIFIYAWQTLLPVVATFVLSALVYRWFSLPILRRVRDSLKQQRNQTK
jgi:peptidoglycan/LPS O-acetylase OafA/YrhL